MSRILWVVGRPSPELDSGDKKQRLPEEADKLPRHCSLGLVGVLAVSELPVAQAQALLGLPRESHDGSGRFGATRLAVIAGSYRAAGVL